MSKSKSKIEMDCHNFKINIQNQEFHNIFSKSKSISRIIMISTPSSQNSIGLFNAVQLTKDHRPSDKQEIDRISKSGGLVDRTKDSKGKPFGPFRVFD